MALPRLVCCPRCKTGSAAKLICYSQPLSWCLELLLSITCPSPSFITRPIMPASDMVCVHVCADFCCPWPAPSHHRPTSSTGSRSKGNLFNEKDYIMITPF